MSFPRYPKYRDSGVEWLGEVPEDWDVVRFKQLFAERQERSVLGEEVLLSVSAYTGVSPRSELIEEGEFLSRAETLEGYKRCFKGDLVINIMLAWNRGLGFTDYDGIVSPSYCVFALTRNEEPRFLDYLVRSDEYIRYFKAYSSGVIDSRLRLYPDTFGQLFCALPSHGEQVEIASFLDRETAKIDALVAEQHRLMELLKEKRQAVISHAVAKGLILDAPMKPSGVEWLGEVPAHWEVVPLRSLISLKHGYAFDGDAFSASGDYVLMTPGNFDERGGFRAKVPEKFYAGPNVPTGFVLGHQQLLVAMTEQAPGLLGAALFVPDGAQYLHNQRLGLVHSLQTERVIEKFLFYTFNSSQYRTAVSLSATGAKVRHTSPNRMLAVRVPLPSLLDQRQICSFLDTTLAEMDELEVESERTVRLLHERRSALISAAVTGQIDVRHLAQEAAA